MVTGTTQGEEKEMEILNSTCALWGSDCSICNPEPEPSEGWLAPAAWETELLEQEQEGPGFYLLWEYKPYGTFPILKGVYSTEVDAERAGSDITQTTWVTRWDVQEYEEPERELQATITIRYKVGADDVFSDHPDFLEREITEMARVHLTDSPDDIGVSADVSEVGQDEPLDKPDEFNGDGYFWGNPY
jgi:hypothetical protein